MTSRFFRVYVSPLAVVCLLFATAVGCPGTIQDPSRFFKDGVPIQPDAAPKDNPPADNPPADKPPPADNPPADNPPADTPPADNPPVERPPAEQPPAERPPAACDPAPIFKSKCNFCHGDTMPSADLSLTGDATAVFDTLKDKSSKCAGSKVIDVSDVLKSVFWIKVSEPKEKQCVGGRMPVGSELSATDLDCIKKWLEANANK